MVNTITHPNWDIRKVKMDKENADSEASRDYLQLKRNSARNKAAVENNPCYKVSNLGWIYQLKAELFDWKSVSYKITQLWFLDLSWNSVW